MYKGISGGRLKQVPVYRVMTGSRSPEVGSTLIVTGSVFAGVIENQTSSSALSGSDGEPLQERDPKWGPMASVVEHVE